MLKNDKGFSLIELFAMILLSTIIIWPLMQSLVSNIQINDRLTYRRSATSIAEGSLFTLDKLNFIDLRDLVDNANTVTFDYYVELKDGSCDQLSDPGDVSVCTQLFNSIWNNLTLSSTEFRIFIINYNLDSAMLGALDADTYLPSEVRDEISLITPVLTEDVNDISSLLRVIVWIQYYNDPVANLIVSGVVFDE